jgi:catechol 2,3-dioxygenase-like lactoylglutathione lyase family enzyme
MKRGDLKEKIVSGIQQIGIGVTNLREAWRWYREYFGMDVRIFEDNTVADLMLPYTSGKPQKRHAALALNLQGGGGFEIWQYTERTPQPPKQEIKLGDLGINAAKIKSKNVRETYQLLKEKGQRVMSLCKDPAGLDHFFVRDPFNNIFQVISGEGWFKNERKLTGATYGAVIGVSDIDKARKLYSSILGYDEVVYDKIGSFEDLQSVPGGQNTFRRTLLKNSKSWKGSFSRLFGPSVIELLQVTNRKPFKIYEGRQWGDLGFIHLCYDVTGMDALRSECSEKGFPFKVDSTKHHEKSFDMGEAAGQFSYVEDPDGTLIEFVETHKIPVIKKIGWYINLRKRNPEKPLPNWMLKALSFNRVNIRES